MGFLDHSTNNIILDAVLTDYGRQQLSLSNSSFNITHFSLGDDEVDYRMIKRYGRAVGKDKIEKNTPIFEALTNPAIALKYRLIGRESGGAAISQIFLPLLSSSPASVSLINNVNNNTVSKQVILTLTYKGSSNPSDLADIVQTSYQIKVPDRFFTLSNSTNGSLTTVEAAFATIVANDPSRMATYTLTPTNPEQPIGFTVNVRSLDNTTATIYGKKTSATERTITSNITVIGNRHGVTLNLPVSYTLIS